MVVDVRIQHLEERVKSLEADYKRLLWFIATTALGAFVAICFELLRLTKVIS